MYPHEGHLLPHIEARAGRRRPRVRFPRRRSSKRDSRQRPAREPSAGRPDHTPPAPVGRRIVVTGMAGSGKSTFGRALAARTGLPVIHLDVQFWKPGWVEPALAEWREKQRELLTGDAWIAEGNYHETLDVRLERADTVVVLDLPWWLCSGRAFLRGFHRPDELPEGCVYSSWRRLRDEWRLAVIIWRNRRVEPERERDIISRHGKHAVLHVLTSKQAVREFLDALDSAH